MTNKIDPVLIGLIRRVMPNMIAQQIASVQPMTGLSIPGSPLTARYAGHSLGCEGMCGDGEAFGVFYETVVDFPFNHRLVGNSSEAIIWACQNIQNPFNYANEHIGSKYPRTYGKVKVFRWSFSDPNDALAFKIRWM